MTIYLLFPCFFLSPIVAFPWLGPRETISVTAAANWSPAPTKGALELFKRDAYPASLCGWQGLDHQGAYCSTGSSCAWFTDYSVVGCCSIGGDCDAVYTGCVDGNHPPQSVSYPGVYTCTSNDVCYQNTFPSRYHQFGCGSTSVGQTVVTAWTGQNPQFSIVIVLTGGVLETEIPVTLISASPSPTQSPTPSPSTSPSPSLEPTPTPSPTRPPSTSLTPLPGPSSSPSPNKSTAPSPRSSPGPSTSKTSPSTSGKGPPGSISASPPASPTTLLSTLLGANTASSTPSFIPKSHGGLSTSHKIAIGVVVGVIGIVALALFIFCCFFRNRREKKAARPASNYAGENVPAFIIPAGNAKTSNYRSAELSPSYHQPVNETAYGSDAVGEYSEMEENRGSMYSSPPMYDEPRVQTPFEMLPTVPHFIERSPDVSATPARTGLRVVNQTSETE